MATDVKAGLWRPVEEELLMRISDKEEANRPFGEEFGVISALYDLRNLDAP